MQNALMKKIDEQERRTDIRSSAPATHRVHVKIKEGDKERLQAFEGVVIARNNTGMGETHHGPQGQLRPGRRAHFPGERAGDRPHRRGPDRPCPPRQAVLPAWPAGQGCPSQRARLAQNTRQGTCRCRQVQEATSCGGKYETRCTPQRLYAAIAGVDEVGRGALFGPVFAAAVILVAGQPDPGTARQQGTRSRSGAKCSPNASVREPSPGQSALHDVYEIDRINILAGVPPGHEAGRRQAVAGLRLPADRRRHSRHCRCHNEAIIHGDAQVQSIAAASILAKTARDQLHAQVGCGVPGVRPGPKQRLRHRGAHEALRRFGPTRCTASVSSPSGSPASFRSGRDTMKRETTWYSMLQPEAPSQLRAGPPPEVPLVPQDGRADRRHPSVRAGHLSRDMALGKRLGFELPPLHAAADLKSNYFRGAVSGLEC